MTADFGVSTGNRQELYRLYLITLKGLRRLKDIVAQFI